MVLQSSQSDPECSILLRHILGQRPCCSVEHSGAFVGGVKGPGLDSLNSPAEHLETFDLARSPKSEATESNRQLSDDLQSDALPT